MTAGWRSRFSAGRLKLTAWRTPGRRCRTGCGVSTSTLRPLPPPCCSSWIYFLLSQRQSGKSDQRPMETLQDRTVLNLDRLLWDDGQTSGLLWRLIWADRTRAPPSGLKKQSLLTLKSVSALQSVFLIVSLLHFKLLDHFLTRTWLMMCIDA